MVPGPDGPREVDARPSDAVNLAVACGAPVLLNASLFEAVHPASRTWEMPAATAQIAAETRERMAAQSLWWGTAPLPGAGGADGEQAALGDQAAG